MRGKGLIYKKEHVTGTKGQGETGRVGLWRPRTGTGTNRVQYDEKGGPVGPRYRGQTKGPENRAVGPSTESRACGPSGNRVSVGSKYPVRHTIPLPGRGNVPVCPNDMKTKKWGGQ
jgi:hypothetical protein